MGEALAGVIEKAAAIGHWILSDWVNVTDASAEGGGQLEFAVTPTGVGFARWAAETVVTYAGVVDGVVHFPRLAASMVELLLELVA